MLDNGPRGYAQYLAGYIRDPSTIRARVADYFGRDSAPTLEACRKLCEKVAAKNDRWKSAAERRATPQDCERFACGHPRSPSNTLQRDNVECCRKCRRDLEAKASKKLREARKQQKAKVAAKVATGKVDVPQGPDRYEKMFRTALVKAVAREFGVTYDDLISQGRNKHLVNARAVCAKIMKENGASYPAIAAAVGRKDHTSAIYLVDSWETRIRHSPECLDVYTFVRGGVV